MSDREGCLQYCCVILFSSAQLYKINAARIAFFPDHKEALISRIACNRRYFFPRAERTNTLPRQSLVSFCSKLRRKLQSPLFLDSLICPACLPLFHSLLPIAGPSSSFQDDPLSKFSVTYTCRVLFRTFVSRRARRCDIDKNDDK